MTGPLARLFAQATPGPSDDPDLRELGFVDVDVDAEERLAALAPDGLRLLTDMAGPIEHITIWMDEDAPLRKECEALLARFAEIEARASAGAEQGAAQ